jgi:hypothetical protein
LCMIAEGEYRCITCRLKLVRCKDLQFCFRSTFSLLQGKSSYGRY